MLQFILAFFLALAPHHHNTGTSQCNGTQVSALETGGETEPIPPKPPKP